MNAMEIELQAIYDEYEEARRNAYDTYRNGLTPGYQSVPVYFPPGSAALPQITGRNFEPAAEAVFFDPDEAEAKMERDAAYARAEEIKNNRLADWDRKRGCKPWQERDRILNEQIAVAKQVKQ